MIPKRLCVRILILVLVATAAAVVSNAARSDGLPWVDERYHAHIEIDEVKALQDSGEASLVDARRPREYGKRRLAGAINIPATELNRKETLDRLMRSVPTEGLVVIYCDSDMCEAANDVYEFMLPFGYRKENLRICTDGWEKIRERADLQFEGADK
ncbi:MAG: rhodanese-like domain-containing protein [Planctomycetota bacterium]|jgi:rhodanese-related sulfurtransferase